jgi:hypothetical protein
VNSRSYKSLVALAFCAVSTVSQAYDQKDCMLGLNNTRQSSSHDEFIKKLSSTNLALLESGVIADYYEVDHLLNTAQLASAGLNSAQIITAMRQNGRFAQPEVIDRILKIEFNGTFAKFKNAGIGFVKLTGVLKNPSLREQAFQLSQELEKILLQIRACEK